MGKEIILASGSVNRKSLLDSLGIPFKIIPSNIDEEAIKLFDPIQKVMATARAKTHAITDKANSLIIAADTISEYMGKQYQKPKDLDEAREMLLELSGKQGRSITGICILDTESQEEILDHRIVNMQCKNLTFDEIEEYIKSRPVTRWAATYNPLDDLSAQIFKPIGNYIYKIEYYGLPIDIVAEALNKVGFNIDLSVFKTR